MAFSPPPFNPAPASAWVRRYGKKIAAASHSYPVLDVACGTGRNAIVLTDLGCEAIGLDIDISKVMPIDRFHPCQIDLDSAPWPFKQSELGGIIQVHFFRFRLIEHFAFSLLPGSYLLIETIPGCGGNFRELPKTGELRTLLGESFELEQYQERKVGPVSADAVTAKLLARRTDRDRLSALVP
jgi:SAM-dependent methyltransferase